MNDQVAEEIKVQQMVRLLRWALIAVVALAVVAVGVTLVQRRADERAQKAFGALFHAEKIEDSAGGAGGAGDAGTEGNSILPPVEKMLAWDAAKKADYVAKLDAVVKDYPGSVASSVAGLRLGRWYFVNKDYDRAVEAFRLVVEHSGDDKDRALYAGMASEGLAVSFESKGQLDEAYRAYVEAQSRKNNPLKPLAYIGAGRVLALQGKVSDAREQYQKVINEFPNSEYERRARGLLALTPAPSKG